MMRRFFPSTIRVGVAPNTAGEVWDLVSTPVDLPWQGLAYGNGIWTAVADGGVNPVMSSPDGLVWTQNTATNRRWRDVVFSETLGIFCAAGNGGIMTSSNGTTWTDRTSTAGFWWGIDYGNGYFVACSNARIQYSANGTSGWTQVATPAGDFRTVKYCDTLNLWVAAGGSGKIITATDPTGTWTDRSIVPNVFSTDFDWSNDVLISGDFNANTNVGIRTVDGINFTVPTSPLSGSRESLTFGNGLYFTAFFDESTDGITWVDSRPKRPAGVFVIGRLRYADNKFVGVIRVGSAGFRALISQ